MHSLQCPQPGSSLDRKGMRFFPVVETRIVKPEKACVQVTLLSLWLGLRFGGELCAG